MNTGYFYEPQSKGRRVAPIVGISPSYFGTILSARQQTTSKHRPPAWHSVRFGIHVSIHFLSSISLPRGRWTISLDISQSVLDRKSVV